MRLLKYASKGGFARINCNGVPATISTIKGDPKRVRLHVQEMDWPLTVVIKPLDRISPKAALRLIQKRACTVKLSKNQTELLIRRVKDCLPISKAGKKLTIARRLLSRKKPSENEKLHKLHTFYRPDSSEAGFYEELVRLDKQIAKNPQDATARSRRAEIYHQMGKYPKEQQDLEILFNQQPSNRDFRSLLVNSYKRSGDKEKSDLFIAKLNSYHKGDLALLNKEWHLAICHFERAEQNWETHLGLARAFKGLNRYPQTDKYFTLAMEQSHDPTLLKEALDFYQSRPNEEKAAEINNRIN